MYPALPFEKVDAGLGKLSLGGVFRIDNRFDIVVRELTAQASFEILSSFGQTINMASWTLNLPYLRESAKAVIVALVLQY